MATLMPAPSRRAGPPRVGRRDDHAGLAQRRSWRSESCGSPGVPHTWAITGRSCASRAARAQPAGRVGVRAVPDHDVEQHAADASSASASMPSRTSRSTIGCGRPCVYTSSPRSKIVWPRRSRRRRCRRSRPGRLEDRDRLVRERAAGVQAEQRPSAARVDLARQARPAPRARRGERPGVERRMDLERRLAAVPAHERRHDALAVDVDVAERLTASRDGGLDTSNSVSVASSAASIRIASPNMIPPTRPTGRARRRRRSARRRRPRGRAGSPPPARRCRPRPRSRPGRA